MEPVLTRLPSYARGLKLVRLGVFVMLAQLALTAVMTIKAVGADTTKDALDTFTWIEYFLWANLGATFAMLIGNLLAIPDFRRARLPIHLVVIAIAGFAIATVALWWTHHVLSTFIEVALDPDASADDVVSAAERFSSLGLVAVVKDLAYVSGLIAVLRTVRQSAVANDQLALRDVASQLTGLLVVMLIADLFYQLTYGLGAGGVGFLGLIGSVLVGGYWIYCHLRLTRFLENAAYFVNEPHHVPTATVVSISTVGETPRVSAPTPPAPRSVPATPSAPVIVVAPELRAAPAPRAPSAADDAAADAAAGPPRFLT